MLKPKKKITRKEIQRDPFLESVDQAQAHLEENRSLYMKLAIGLIVVLLGYNVMTEKRTQHKLEASAALGQALIALDRGDVNNAQFQLETVLNEFEGTPSSSVASYYLGKMKYGDTVHYGRIDATCLKTVVPDTPVKTNVLIF